MRTIKRPQNTEGYAFVARCPLTRPCERFSSVHPSPHRNGRGSGFTSGHRNIAGAHYRKDESELTMSTPDQTLLQLIDLAASHFRVPASELNPDDDFFKKLKINSLQALDLLTKLESHFNVELPDYELQGVTDFRTLADRIQARL